MSKNIAIIGADGFIGSILSDYYKDNNITKFNRANLEDVDKNEYDVVIIAAPTGNSALVVQQPPLDWYNCEEIISSLKFVKCQHIIHISTIDVFEGYKNNDDTLLGEFREKDNDYGYNRFYYEKELNRLYDNVLTLRLPTVIYSGVKKNLLYDLMNREWLYNISLDTEQQWYPLNQLGTDIDYVLENNIKAINLVSAPIPNREIVQQYFTDPLLNNLLSENTITPRLYNVKTAQDPSGYWVSNDKIWQALDELLK